MAGIITISKNSLAGEEQPSTVWALANVNQISVDELNRHYARAALDRMLALR